MQAEGRNQDNLFQFLLPHILALEKYRKYVWSDVWSMIINLHGFCRGKQVLQDHQGIQGCRD